MTEPLIDLVCPSVREDGAESCTESVGHRGPHRGRLGTWVWREDDKRCTGQREGKRCMLSPGHVREHAVLP